MSLRDALHAALTGPTHTEGELPSLDGATGWLNSEPLTMANLNGKVVLVDFWTYTCINWLRTLPYVRAWAERYKDHGLVVIGVHTPEFGFEHDIDNVRDAVREMRVDYPVALDNDYAVWRAFDNHYWPALYFVDAHGQIRSHHFGEGEYEQSERIVQQLLDEAGFGGFDRDLASVDPEGPEVAADWETLRSGENYLGYERSDNFASPGGVVPGESHRYTSPEQLRLNQWALSGTWEVGRGAIGPTEPDGRIAYRFEARDLNLVMAPTMRGGSVRFRLLIDGEPPGAAHGVDCDERGDGTATEQRMYQLVREPGRVTERTCELTFLDPEVELYAFTFG